LLLQQVVVNVYETNRDHFLSSLFGERASYLACHVCSAVLRINCRRCTSCVVVTRCGNSKTFLQHYMQQNITISYRRKLNVSVHLYQIFLMFVCKKDRWSFCVRSPSRLNLFSRSKKKMCSSEKGIVIKYFIFMDFSNHVTSVSTKEIWFKDAFIQIHRTILHFDHTHLLC
jgi:hypothetical protein